MNKKPTLEESLGGLPNLTGGTPVVQNTPAAPAKKAASAPKKVEIPSDLDPSLLTAEQKEAIRAEVEAELYAEAQADAAADYRATLKKELIQKNIKHAEDVEADDAVELRVDLARHVPYIRLDNTTYYPGYTYWVSPDTAKVLKDQMYRSFLHDAEISGLDINDYFGRHHALSVLSGRKV